MSCKLWEGGNRLASGNVDAIVLIHGLEQLVILELIKSRKLGRILKFLGEQIGHIFACSEKGSIIPFTIRKDHNAG
jgi:hypothetical protein